MKSGGNGHNLTMASTLNVNWKEESCISDTKIQRFKDTNCLCRQFYSHYTDIACSIRENETCVSANWRLLLLYNWSWLTSGGIGLQTIKEVATTVFCLPVHFHRRKGLLEENNWKVETEELWFFFTPQPTSYILQTLLICWTKLNKQL